MPTGSNEHAEGLMLLRASTLKIIRLQLAIERHDRRVAIEAMDDLVALDRQLQDCLAAIPASGEQLMFQRALDSERAVLNKEKLTLAAEVLRRPTNCTDRSEAIGKADQWDDDWLGPRNLEPETEEPRSPRWLSVPAILAVCATVATYFVSEPHALAWLAAITGSIK